MASDDWSIDLADPNKVLEVKVDLAPAIVIAAVKERRSRPNNYKRMAARQRQTYGEEVANVLTHGAGMLFGMTAIIILMMAAIRSGNPWAIGSFAVYVVCMTLFVCDVYILPCFDPCTTEKDSCGGSIMVRFICILRELIRPLRCWPSGRKVIGVGHYSPSYGSRQWQVSG